MSGHNDQDQALLQDDQAQQPQPIPPLPNRPNPGGNAQQPVQPQRGGWQVGVRRPRGGGGGGLQPVQPLPQPVAQWTDDTLRALGWASKKQAQKRTAGDIRAAIFNEYEKAVPQKGSETLAKRGSGDDTFQTLLRQLKVCENRPPEDQVDTEMNNLLQRAQDYLLHFGRMNSLKQKFNIKEKEAAEQIVNNVTQYQQSTAPLTQALQQAGNPPWGDQTSMRMASVKASSDLMSVEGKLAKPLGSEGGVNSAFWIERGMNRDLRVEPKTFIFKPQINQQGDLAQFPAGGEASREAMAGRTAEHLSVMTGIDFGMPDTHVISLDESQLPQGSLGTLPVAKTGTSVKGSLQQFSATQGELKKQPSATRRKVTPQSCQQLAILDTVMLNCDRHAGNFMVKPNGPNADLVPIDHGLTFPPAAALPVLAENFGSEKNALLKMPGAYEAFDPQMLQKIAAIEPAALEGAFKKDRNDIEAVHPETQGKVTDESLLISRRSTMFLQLAAPQLPPAVLQVALGQNAETLLDPAIDEQTFQQRANVVIQAAVPNVAGLKEYFLMSDEERKEMRELLKDNGWPAGPNGQLSERWLLANIPLALKVFKSRTPNPEAIAFIDERLGAPQRQQMQQQGRPMSQMLQQARNATPNDCQSQNWDQQSRQDLTDAKQMFPVDLRIWDPVQGEGGLTPGQLNGLGTQLANWRKFKRLRGHEQGVLDQAIASAGLTGPDAANVRRTIADALRVMMEAKGLQTAAPNLPDDPQGKRALELTLGYVGRVLAVLPNNLRGQFSGQRTQLLMITQSPNPAPPGLRGLVETLQDNVADAVREYLLQSVPQTRQAAQGNIDQTYADKNGNPFKGAVADLNREIALIEGSIHSGNVLAAKQSMDQLAQRPW